MTKIVKYQDEHFLGVDALWSKVFPNSSHRNQAAQAIPAKLSLDDGLFWVALDRQGDFVGTTMAGWDGHRGWLYTVAVEPKLQGAGIGTLLVEHAIARLSELGCNKVNLQVRVGNEQVSRFYQKLGFAVEERVSMGREL